MDLLTLPDPMNEAPWKKKEVDRWIGQEMTEEQIRKIDGHCKYDSFYHIPAWAKGLQWFLYHTSDKDLTMHPEYPWDFGIYADGYLYRKHIKMSDELSARLSKRQSVMATFVRCEKKST